MINVKNGYPQRTMTGSGSTMTTVYYSKDQAEINALQMSHPIGENTADGYLKSNALKPDNGMWELELVYQSNSDSTGPVLSPDTAYGAKSVQIHGSMLSLQLETLPEYRANWNYFLFADPTVKSAPAWWATAKDVVLDGTQAQKYAWAKSAGETPVVGGKRWALLKMPTKPGVESYDYAVYTMTEAARYRSCKLAIQAITSRLNKIVTPIYDVSLPAGGNWKCDDANVQWTGKYWIGSYSYTLSGPGGWDTDLYSFGS